MDFKATRSISRLHYNPIIHELENCNVTPIIKTRYRKGQTIQYGISARGTSVTNVRSMLLNELAFLVFAGGVEMPGGTEVWESNPPSVSVSFQKYYATPVVSNIED
jgi:hypothetical protein